MKTLYSIITEVVVRGGISTTTSTAYGLYTDTILTNWADQAHRWAAAYKPWPFTEARVSTTFTGTEEWTFPDASFKADSIRLLQIGGKRLQKINFEDYQIFREEQSGATDRVYSDFARMLFINPDVDLSGTLTAWGQYQPVEWSDTTDNASVTVFSTNEDEGNEAIVQEVLSFVKDREKKPEESKLHHQNALQLLDNLWRRMGDEQFGYQGKNRGMWERVDIVNGSYYDDTLDTDQF